MDMAYEIIDYYVRFFPLVYSTIIALPLSSHYTSCLQSNITAAVYGFSLFEKLQSGRIFIYLNI